MKTKNNSHALPAEDAGGQPVQVAQRSPGYVQETVFEPLANSSPRPTREVYHGKTNGVLNLQFIGNGCVASYKFMR